MEIKLKPETGDVQYSLYFIKPFMHLLYVNDRIKIIEKCINLFSLRMADIVFETELSTNNISFKKFITNAMLYVSFGADEANATLRRTEEFEQTAELLSLFNSLFESEEARKKILIRKQLSSTSNLDLYFKNMITGLPKNMNEYIRSEGFSFELDFDELVIKCLIEKSISLDNGIFELFEFSFIDPTQKFEDIYRISHDHYYKINKELGIMIEEE